MGLSVVMGTPPFSAPMFQGTKAARALKAIFRTPEGFLCETICFNEILHGGLCSTECLAFDDSYATLGFL
jgi:hypothetical protein